MSGILQFLNEFLNQLFVNGFWQIIKGIGLGIANIFHVPKYVRIFRSYAGQLGVGGIILGVTKPVIKARGSADERVVANVAEMLRNLAANRAVFDESKTVL